jgi:phosphoglycolate phosphatase-like HAD superfamily hydrolase
MTIKVQSILTNADNIENLIDKFHTEIGWDNTRDNVIPSAPVAAGTWDNIVGFVYNFLVEHQDLIVDTAITKDLALQWHAELGDLHEHDTPLLDDLAGMMKACDELGYTVAICTSDDRGSTDKAMQRWGIDKVVTFSVCGNEVDEGKPSALPLQTLCEQASSMHKTYHPHDCIVVGDTSSDTGMARAAKAGFCIGVLTGSGTVEQLLDTGAHLILPHVGYVPKLLKNFQKLAQTDTLDL